MTAWPLNCAAAQIAEDVVWQRSANARHALLIDTPAVPLRFADDAPRAVAYTAIDHEPGESRARRIAQLFTLGVGRR